MKWSLNKKLILIMVSLSVAIVVSMLIFDFYSERLLYRKLGEKIGNIMDSTRVAIEEMTRQEKTPGTDLLQSLAKMHTEGLREVNIIDSAIRIRASTNRSNIGKEATKEITNLVFRSEEGEFVQRKGSLYNVIIPIVVKGEHQGYIHFVIGTDDITHLFRAHILRRIIVALLILSGGILLAFGLASRYTRPIKEVVTGASAVSSGDLDVSLEVTEKDEIGDLKESFNLMVKRLRELKLLEERLRETEYLATMGELSGTLAHEIRNPLNFISLSVDHLTGKVDDNGKALLLRIKEEIKRLNSLVENFLSYGRPIRLSKRPVSVVSLLEDTLTLVTAKAEKVGISIERNYNGLENMTINVDSELLKSCLFNVILNSFQAMKEGGRLSVSLSKEDGYVCITISDTGKGINREDIQKVFEPFFTTKERGVGLGLPMTRRVMEEHGGSVELESTPGKGTTVTLRLPL